MGHLAGFPEVLVLSAECPKPRDPHGRQADHNQHPSQQIRPGEHFTLSVAHND